MSSSFSCHQRSFENTGNSTACLAWFNAPQELHLKRDPVGWHPQCMGVEYWLIILQYTLHRARFWGAVLKSCWSLIPVHCRVIETPHPLSPLAPDLWINQTQKPGPNPLFIPGLILYTGTIQRLPWLWYWPTPPLIQAYTLHYGHTQHDMACQSAFR